MKPGPKTYEPTAMERAAKQEQRHEKKRMRPQVWKEWVCDDGIDIVEAAPNPESETA